MIEDAPQAAEFPVMQLDLFAHGREVMLRNDAIAALRRRDAVAVSNALATLAAEYPADNLLLPLAALVNMPAMRPEHFVDHAAAGNAVHALETAVIPAANAVFGPAEARDWLAPVWRSFASFAAQLPYDARRPHTHAAFMSLQGGDWAAAEAQVATIPSWRRIPIPLAWMAEARFGQGGLESAWGLLVELAWIHPSTFSALTRRLKAPALRRLLDEFSAAFESDDESDLAWFPAWTLIVEPRFAPVMRTTQTCNGTPPEHAARLVVNLLALERQGRHADIVAHRKRLRDLHAGLFSRYMSTR